MGVRWNELGEAKRRTGADNAGAQEAFAKSVQLYRELLLATGGESSLLCEASRAHGNGGALEDSIRLARRATVAAPKDWHVWVALGAALHRKAVATLPVQRDGLVYDEIEIDENALRQLVAAAHDNKPNMERINSARELSDEAKDAFDKAVEVAPTETGPLLARSAYRSAQRLDIDAYADALQGKRSDIGKLGYDYGVRDDILAALKLKPNDPDLLSRGVSLEILCSAAQDSRDFAVRDQDFWDTMPVRTRNAAEERLTRLKALATGSDKAVAASANAQLGSLYLLFVEQEDHADSESYLKNALALDGRNRSALRDLYLLMERDRRHEDMLPILQAFEGAQDCALTHLMLAHTLEATGHTPEASAEVDRALTSSPGDPIANVYKAVLLLRADNAANQADRLAQAHACLEIAQKHLSAKDTTDTVRCRNALAIYEALNGDTAKAEVTVEGALNANRQDTEARDILAALMPL